jgi:hypothetical protein
MHRACADTAPARMAETRYHKRCLRQQGWLVPLRLPGSQLHCEEGTPRKDDGDQEQGRRIMNNGISN